MSDKQITLVPEVKLAPQEFDNNMIWHVCEPEEALKLPSGFYKEYKYSYKCIHCNKVHNIEFTNLNVK
jgi:hypothetical protein